MILHILGAKTFWEAKHVKKQGQSNYLYVFKYILESVGGGAKTPPLRLIDGRI